MQYLRQALPNGPCNAKGVWRATRRWQIWLPAISLSGQVVKMHVFL